MTDKDVQKEVAANHRRRVEDERRDDGTVVDTVEKGIQPITRILNPNPDPPDSEDVARQRQLNDAEQRPD